MLYKVQREMSTCCALYAMYNAGVYRLNLHAKVEPMTYWSLAKMLDEYLPKCDKGPMLRSDKSACIEKYKLPLVQAAGPEEVISSGGVLSIMHPIWNGHAMFIEPPDTNGVAWVVNSFLGPERMALHVDVLKQFFPPHNNFTQYKFSKVL